tara:strand:+ start:249 stop:839 length:591 start_codon:yes stop_codon:yes gene_type:complete
MLACGKDDGDDKKVGDHRYRAVTKHLSLTALYQLIDALQCLVIFELQGEKHTDEADAAARKVVAVMQAFIEEVRGCWCESCMRCLCDLWSMAVCAITTGLEHRADEAWQAAKRRVCILWSQQGRFVEARRLFFHPLRCNDIAPMRPSLDPLPPWFVERVMKEFPTVDYNSALFANNDRCFAWHMINGGLNHTVPYL